MRARRFLPFLLAGGLLLWSGLHLSNVLKAFNTREPANDAVTSWDARMRQVARDLPADVRVVGYLEGSDLDPSIGGRDAAEFYLTKYGLAPTLVEMGIDHDWIVGNFGNTWTPDEIGALLDRRLGTYDIRSHGFGIYLIHRLSR